MNTAILNTDIEEDELQDEAPKEKYIFFDFIIEKGQEPLRIDKYLMTKLANVTRNKIQQAIDDECVYVNDKLVKQNYKIKPEDHIVAYTFREPESTEIIPEDIALDIVYEDDDVLVLNKPFNMVVHPGHGNYTGTVVNALAYYLQQKSENKELLPRIGLVHRIDKDTTGLLVVGKNEKAVLHLSNQFMEHTVNRRYQALVWGDVEENEGTIDTYIGRHERNRKVFTVYDKDDEKGKHAITHYKVIERFNYVTLIECKLETGRTHQIRVHMKHIGHTLFNDATYGGDRVLKGTVFSKYKSFVENCFALCPRQALHAKTLGFIHPTTGKEMLFESEMPADIQSVLERWKVYVKAKGI
ncbi:MAG TPA: RluA family pseudouridine synthase [Chitinophagaceae bacterium]|nr:RluA family pseudouridine synthase [Chitinophagaceae bacterium]